MRQKMKSGDNSNSETIQKITDLGFDLKNGEDIFPSALFNLKSLIWARAHYLARRFPLQNSFLPSSLSPSSSSSFPHTLPPHLSSILEYKEKGFGEMASLCPFLDFVNHKSGKCWIKIEVTPDALEISTNIPLSEGDEIFHNYGTWANETFLCAFAFTLEDNEDDGLFVKLMAANAHTPHTSESSLTEESAEALGAFTVKKGGLKGVPKV